MAISSILAVIRTVVPIGSESIVTSSMSDRINVIPRPLCSAPTGRGGFHEPVSVTVTLTSSALKRPAC